MYLPLEAKLRLTARVVKSNERVNFDPGAGIERLEGTVALKSHVAGSVQANYNDTFHAPVDVNSPIIKAQVAVLLVSENNQLINGRQRNLRLSIIGVGAGGQRHWGRYYSGEHQQAEGR